MSYLSIRSVLELRLNAMTVILPTAWENVPFTQPSTAFQRVYLLPADTNNPTYGDSLAMESGIFQISVCYPEGNGPADALTRAEALRAWFPRGLSLTDGNVTVRISRKPSIAPAQREPGLYVIPVSISYFSYI